MNPIHEGLRANDLLTSVPLPPGWQWRELRAEGRQVRVLQANDPAGVLSLPLNRTGRHEIHLGLFRPKGAAPAMQVRLSPDRFWRKIQPYRFMDDPGGGLQDGLLGVLDMESDAELLIRPLPERIAALAYVLCKPSSARPVSRKGKLGAVMDVHDIMATQYEIHNADDLRAVIAPFADSAFDRICWGNAAGSFRATYFSRVMPRMGEGLEQSDNPWAQRHVTVMQRLEKRGEDPLRVITDFAHEIGLQLWSDDRICHTFDPACGEYPHLVSDFVIKNQHMRVRNKDGSQHRQAMLSLAYPQFRDLKVRFLAEQARYGVDGIYIDWTRKSPVVGWEPAVIEPFKSKHGKDPHRLPQSEWIVDWLAHQCGFVTEFMRELRAELDKAGAETGRRIPIAVQVPHGWHHARAIPEFYWNGLDVAAWAREGLVDIVAPSADLWHAPIRLDHLPPMFDGTGCELWGCIHQRVPECFPSRKSDDRHAFLEAHLDPMIVLRAAADLYNSGAEGLFLWECGETPGVLPRWELLRHLGDRDRLTLMFGPKIGRMDGKHRFEQYTLE